MPASRKALSHSAWSVISTVTRFFFNIDPVENGKLSSRMIRKISFSGSEQICHAYCCLANFDLILQYGAEMYGWRILRSPQVNKAITPWARTWFDPQPGIGAGSASRKCRVRWPGPLFRSFRSGMGVRVGGGRGSSRADGPGAAPAAPVKKEHFFIISPDFLEMGAGIE